MQRTFDIHGILSQGEHLTLECKLAQNNLPNSIWETYSAFANTNGGTIILGVEENMSEKDLSKRFSISGVSGAAKVIKEFWNQINNKQKVSINLLKSKNLQLVDVEGKEVIVITVPRAEYTVRPVYINDNLSRGTFKRNNEGDFHCTEQELRMMVRDAYEEGNDRLILEYYTMDDIDIPTLEKYRVLFKTDHPDHPWNNIEHKEFLTHIGGYTVNRKDGSEALTMAGLLMFGKGLPIRERFDNIRMDYIDKSNLVGDQRYSDRLTYDGTWENNLFNFMFMVLPRLTRDLPRPFKMEGMVRKDDTLQHKAVREAFTNMIIHSDLMLNGLLRVEKYNDKFVLTNPGLLKLPVEQIYTGGESKARNQRIQNMLRMIGYGENIGSGFPLILSAWDANQWIKPELIEQPELMQVKLVLHIEKDNSSTNVQKDVQKDVHKKLTDRQNDILRLIEEQPSITRDEMSKRLNVSTKTIQRDMEAMQSAGLIIRREGGNTYGYWTIQLTDICSKQIRSKHDCSDN